MNGLSFALGHELDRRLVCRNRPDASEQGLSQSDHKPSDLLILPTVDMVVYSLGSAMWISQNKSGRASNSLSLNPTPPLPR